MAPAQEPDHRWRRGHHARSGLLAGLSEESTWRGVGPAGHVGRLADLGARLGITRHGVDVTTTPRPSPPPPSSDEGQLLVLVHGEMSDGCSPSSTPSSST